MSRRSDRPGPRCHDCGYRLDGLPAGSCPECATWFDPDDALSFDSGVSALDRPELAGDLRRRCRVCGTVLPRPPAETCTKCRQPFDRNDPATWVGPGSTAFDLDRIAAFRGGLWLLLLVLGVIVLALPLVAAAFGLIVGIPLLRVRRPRPARLNLVRVVLGPAVLALLTVILMPTAGLLATILVGSGLPPGGDTVLGWAAALLVLVAMAHVGPAVACGMILRLSGVPEHEVGPETHAIARRVALPVGAGALLLFATIVLAAFVNLHGVVPVGFGSEFVPLVVGLVVFPALVVVLPGLMTKQLAAALIRSDDVAAPSSDEATG